MNTDKTLRVLNTLLETCYDGEYGFRSCAEHIKADDLRALLTQRATECDLSARELRALIAKLGGKADERTSTSGTVSGALHRGWVSVRAALTTADDAAMLEECERGEDRALARYRDALKEELPTEVANLVQRQMAGVQRNHDLIRDLRDRARMTS